MKARLPEVVDYVSTELTDAERKKFANSDHDNLPYRFP